MKTEDEIKILKNQVHILRIRSQDLFEEFGKLKKRVDVWE